MKLDTALYQLKRSPLTFLRNNVLTLVSSGASGVKNYYFAIDNKQAEADANEFFRLTPYPDLLNNAPTGSDGKFRVLVPVHHLGVISNTAPLDIEDITPYVLDHTGPSMMITTLLSACIIAVQKVGNQLVLAHLQPAGNRPTSTVFRGIIQREGKFTGYQANNGHVEQVIGLGLEYTKYCNLIGLRSGTQWHLYGQLMNTPKGPITEAVQFV